MFSIENLQNEVNQLIDLYNKFPNVIQKEKIDRILESWDVIKANPDKHEGTSSIDIFKRDLKGCISLLEGKGAPHSQMDSGANINNLQARLARLNPNQGTQENSVETQNSIPGKMSSNDREMFLAQDIKQKIEIELKALVDGGSDNVELMREKSVIIKSLEILITNLKG